MWLRLGSFPGGVDKAWSPRAQQALGGCVVDGGPVVVPWKSAGVKMALRVFPVAVHAADGMVLMHFQGLAVESHGPPPHHLLL